MSSHYSVIVSPLILVLPYDPQDIHKDLGQKLAQFHEREDCILYASCFDANAGLFEVCDS